MLSLFLRVDVAILNYFKSWSFNLNVITKEDDLFVANFPSMVMLHQDFFSAPFIIAETVQAPCSESLVMILL